MRHDELFQKIENGDIGTHYIFTGPERLVMSNAINAMAKRLDARILKYESYELNDILKLLRNKGLFGNRLVVVLDTDKALNDIAAFQNKSINTLIIIHSGNKLPAGFQSIEFNKLAPLDLRKIVQSNLKIQNSIADLLVAVSEHDSSTLWNNINKLKHYAVGRAVTEEDIETVCHIPDALEIFHLVDAICRKEREKALYIYHKLRENDVVLLSLMYSQFRKVLMVKYLYEDGKRTDDIVSITGLQRFLVNNCIAMSANFSRKALVQIVMKLYDIDFKIKTGRCSTALIYSFILYIL